MSAEQERLAQIEERASTFWRYTVNHGSDGVSVGHDRDEALVDVRWLVAQLRQAQEREAEAIEERDHARERWTAWQAEAHQHSRAAREAEQREAALREALEPLKWNAESDGHNFTSITLLNSQWKKIKEALAAQDSEA